MISIFLFFFRLLFAYFCSNFIDYQFCNSIFLIAFCSLSLAFRSPSVRCRNSCQSGSDSSARFDSSFNSSSSFRHNQFLLHFHWHSFLLNHFVLVLPARLPFDKSKDTCFAHCFAFIFFILVRAGRWFGWLSFESDHKKCLWHEFRFIFEFIFSLDFDSLFFKKSCLSMPTSKSTVASIVLICLCLVLREPKAIDSLEPINKFFFGDLLRNRLIVFLLFERFDFVCFRHVNSFSNSRSFPYAFHTFRHVPRVAFDGFAKVHARQLWFVNIRLSLWLHSICHKYLFAFFWKCTLSISLSLFLYFFASLFLCRFDFIAITTNRLAISYHASHFWHYRNSFA